MHSPRATGPGGQSLALPSPWPELNFLGPKCPTDLSLGPWNPCQLQSSPPTSFIPPDIHTWDLQEMS